MEKLDSTRLLTVPPLKSFVLPLWGPTIRLLTPRCQGARFSLLSYPDHLQCPFPRWADNPQRLFGNESLSFLPSQTLLPQTVRTQFGFSLSLGVCVRDLNLCLFSVNSSEVRAGEQTVRKPTDGNVSRYTSWKHGSEHTCFPAPPLHSLWLPGFVF